MFHTVKKYYKVINRLHVFFFASGILTGLLFYFYSEDNYESRVFRTLAKDVIVRSGNNQSDTNIFINSLKLVHQVLNGRQEMFSDVGGLNANVIQPVTVDLMISQGACGSYSLVMTRLLQELGYDTRVVQMKVSGIYGGHILVEAKHASGWVVLDPSYNLYFRDANGKLASFDEVKADWPFFSRQVPQGYNPNYKYDDKRYTNWEKIPIIMPAVKTLLSWIIGSEKANTFSLRVFTLRKFHILFIITLIFQCLLVTYLLLCIVQKNKKLEQTASKVLTKKLKEKSTKGSIVLIKPTQANAISEK